MIEFQTDTGWQALQPFKQVRTDVSRFLTKGGYPGIFGNIRTQGLRPLAKLRTGENSAEENILDNYKGVIQRSDVLKLHLQLIQAHLWTIWHVKIETAIFNVKIETTVFNGKIETVIFSVKTEITVFNVKIETAIFSVVSFLANDC